jgi:predicted MFS family arabinose efflux permease
MYLLLTLITRYAQTQQSAGYGFALTTFEAGLVLVPFSVLGYGGGSFSAAMPSVILAVTPAGETSSAMSFNQVVRSVGCSLGSAIGGLILSAGTPAGGLFPANSAYTTAAWVGAAVMAVSAATSLVR